jgi:beta-galactosidase
MAHPGLSRRRVLQIAGLGGATALGGLAAPPAQEAAPYFPYGAIHMSTISHWQHYLPPLAEYSSYMENEIRNMKEVRFNTLVIHVDWYDIETSPGRFVFDRLDRLMDLVEKHGMKALLWPWPELQPEWVINSYPDAEWIASDGYRPGSACWDHSEVRSLIERFVEKAVVRYRDRPSVIGWDVGAEAGIWVAGIGNPVDQKGPSRLYCYCEHTKRRYRDWLRRKYGTIDKLNEIWASYHEDWSQIQPVRTGVFERAQIFWTDWREFMLSNTTEFQRLKAETVHRLDAHHPATAHTGGWGSGYVHHGADEYDIAKHFDVLSLSFFPYWLESGYGFYHPFMGGLMLDGCRSAGNGKPMWIEELQGGPSISGLTFRSRMPRPQDIRLWAWQSVAHSAKGIFYWNWRPETTGIEASGFGLVNYDGSLTDRVREAGHVSGTLQTHARLFADAAPVAAEIAVLHSPRTAILTAGEGDEGVCLMSEAGLYLSLWKRHIPVDFLVPEQLLKADLSRYKVLYLPFAYTLSPAEGAQVRAFVENGGALYAELWCGLKDHRTFLYEQVPGAGLAEVLHAKELSVVPVKSGAMTVAARHESLPLVAEGAQIPVYKYQEELALLPGANVLAKFSDGTPALIAGTFGKGKTLYAATMLCRGVAESRDQNASDLLAGFALAAGVKAPVEVAAEPKQAAFEVRLLETRDGRRVFFFLNHEETPVAAAVTLPAGTRTLANLTTGAKLNAVEKAGRPQLALRLEGGGVLVAAEG